MALRRARTRQVLVKQPLSPAIYGDLATPAFEQEGKVICAAVQPLSGSMAATLYGEESALMRLLLTTDSFPLLEGMGVCVERRDGECDYRVSAPPERWGTHWRAILKRL